MDKKTILLAGAATIFASSVALAADQQLNLSSTPKVSMQQTAASCTACCGATCSGCAACSADSDDCAACSGSCCAADCAGCCAAED